MIYFGTDSGLYRWFEGAPWPVFHGLQHRPIAGLAVGPGGAMAAIDAPGRIWETTDNGLRWREAVPPEGVGRPTAITLFGSPATLWMAARPLALFQKHLGGPGWVPLGMPADPSGSPAGPARFLAAEAGAWFASVDGAGLWRSADEGRLWSACSGLPDQVFTLRGSGDRLIAATPDGVAVSGDGGQTWEPAGDLPGGRHVRAIAVRPDDPSQILAGAAPGPARTEAGPDTDARRPAGLGFRLFESRDGGKSWSHVRRGFPDALEFDQIADIRFDPDAPDCAIVALSSGECWRTANGGEWWEPIARRIGAVRSLAAASANRTD